VARSRKNLLSLDFHAGSIVLAVVEGAGIFRRAREIPNRSVVAANVPPTLARLAIAASRCGGSEKPYNQTGTASLTLPLPASLLPL
jgi:hypothetical protein